MADRNLSNSSIPKNAMNSFTRSCKNEALPGALETCQRLKKVLPGNLSYHSMHSAGLEYTNGGDIARCHTCGFEVSDLRSDMEPFAIHKQRSPSCPFILSMLPSPTIIIPTTNNPPSISSALVNEEQPLKRLKTDTPVTNSLSNILVEVDSLKQVRKRTFSHWPHRSSPSASQMIEAGFFNCNVGDRVICIYCNIICQQWTPNSDDPCEVHKTFSPKCPYVIGMLTAPQTTSTLHVQKNSSNSDSQQIIANLNKTAINKKYIEAKKRLASFATWLDGNLPSIDDLVRAGFFYTGTKSKVTCFYCNGSLQNWGINDNPMVEHARWFPHCAYAKQLCGVELRRTIQESKRAQQEKVNTHHSNNALETDHGSLIGERLSIPDEDTLLEMVVARLDLPISKCMINRNFKQSIIKKCWEDQLRLKDEDFVCDCDLLMAYIIIQKQVEYINGKKENIIVPSIAMKKVRDQDRTADIRLENQTNKTQLTNPCVLCLEEEKCLACIPCGHLITCIPCSQVFRSCSTCHTKIDAFVRIYS